MPKIENDQVLVEFYNGDGKVVSSKMHKLSPVLWHRNSVWADKKTIQKIESSSGSNKVELTKRKKKKNILFKTVGYTRVAKQQNGTPVAKIGG